MPLTKQHGFIGEFSGANLLCSCAFPTVNTIFLMNRHHINTAAKIEMTLQSTHLSRLHCCRALNESLGQQRVQVRLEESIQSLLNSVNRETTVALH